MLHPRHALEMLLQAQDTDSARLITEAALCTAPHWKMDTVYFTKQLGNNTFEPGSLTWSREIAASLASNHCLIPTLLAASRWNDIPHMLGMIAHVPLVPAQADALLRTVLAPAALIPDPMRLAARAFVLGLPLPPSGRACWHDHMMAYLDNGGATTTTDDDDDSRTWWLQSSVYLMEDQLTLYEMWVGAHNVHAVHTFADTGFVLLKKWNVEIRLALVVVDTDDDALYLTKRKVRAKTNILIETRGVALGTELVVQVYFKNAVNKVIVSVSGDPISIDTGHVDIVMSENCCIPTGEKTKCVLMSCTLIF